MIYKNIELFNIADLIEPRDGGVGKQLVRVPGNVIEHLSERGQEQARQTPGCEIRFVAESGEAKLTLRTPTPGTTASFALYIGSMQAGWQSRIEGVVGYEPSTITVKPHPGEVGEAKRATEAFGFPFSANVIRLSFSGAPLIIVDVEGDVRPPREDEVPKLTGIFYGSSITNGSSSTSPQLIFTSRIGRKLKINTRNVGLAGSCEIEPEIVDWLANEGSWDFIVSELGINVWDMDPEEFRKKVRYYLETVHAKNPDKYMFCIDMFYHNYDMYNKDGTPNRLRVVMKEEVERMNSPYIIHIDGNKMIYGADLLTADVVHPNADGCIEIADNLSAFLAPYVEKLR